MKWHETVGGVEAVEITIILKRRKREKGIVGSNDKKKEISLKQQKERKSEEMFTRKVKMGRNQSRINLMGVWNSDDISNTSGITPGKEPSKGEVGNRQGRARQIMDWIVVIQRERTTIVILLCLTARWIVTLRSDQLSDWTLCSS